MLRRLIIATLVLLSAQQAAANQKNLIIYSDATLMELEAVARKGVAEIALPVMIKENSLRVKPLDSGSILKVDILPARPPEKLQKELDSLVELKQRFEDRLKALEARESIFAAAAKSQSAKAPRKSKSNPDPITSIKQGTDFAIAQLEAVLTARRKAEQDLRKTELRIAQLKNKAMPGPIVRVTVSAANERIALSALLNDSGWKARYEVRVSNANQATLAMFAEILAIPEGFTTRVVNSTIHDAATVRPLTVQHNLSPKVAEWQLNLDSAKLPTSRADNNFSLSFKSPSDAHLPPGVVAVYNMGEFIGNSTLSPVPAGSPINIISQK